MVRGYREVHTNGTVGLEAVQETRLVFEAYIEKILLPSLRRGQVVVMDNLSAHKVERIRELLESAGCELLYLPPYSLDFSPIEEVFSKAKGLIRKAEARSREALV
jgi:transposase